jgi:hypothetical protein
MNLKVGMSVLVDNLPGIIGGIYPYGSGQYIGAMHAYIWVKTPTLEFNIGRAVPYEDIEKRITVP